MYLYVYMRMCMLSSSSHKKKSWSRLNKKNLDTCIFFYFFLKHVYILTEEETKQIYLFKHISFIYKYILSNFCYIL